MPFSANLPAENTEPWYSPTNNAWETLTTFVNGLETSTAAKASSTDLSTGLATKVNTSTFTAALAAKADLVSGKVPSSQLPPLIVNETHAAASQAEMLALPAAQGDVAVRTDTNQMYFLTATPASTLGNWVLMSGSVSVTSVAGKTGVVSLVIGDVSGLQAALDSKAATVLGTTTVAGLIELATQAEVDAGTDTTRSITPATLATRLSALSTTDTNRANHTGVQAISSVTNLQTTLDSKVDKITDPNADRLRGWDDSAGGEVYFTLGSGLTVTGTTITAAGGGVANNQVEYTTSWPARPAVSGIVWWLSTKDAAAAAPSGRLLGDIWVQHPDAVVP